MSVIVKGMDMPNCCYVCPLFGYDNGKCQFLHEEPYGLSGMDVRLPNCPLFGDSDNDDPAEKSRADEESERWMITRIKTLERSEE